MKYFKLKPWPNAVPVNELTRQEWLDQVVEELETDPNKDSHFIYSGDTIVAGFRHPDGSMLFVDAVIRAKADVWPAERFCLICLSPVSVQAQKIGPAARPNRLCDKCAGK